MSRFWSDVARRLTPYVPGEQPRHPRLVKLNTNEMPYPPSPAALEALHSVDGEQLRRYPDPESLALRQALADRHQLSLENVFVGNGSDEVLAHVFQGLLKQDRPLLFPDVTYSFYPVWCDLYGISCRSVPLKADFTVDLGGFEAPCGGIILPNPNAPTGLLLGLEGIRELLQRHPDSVLVVDEAYIDFGGESATVLIPEFDNLLVVQTLSKSRALAGLRVGMAFGHRDLIEALKRVKNSFNSYPLDAPAQHAALAAVRDEVWLRDSCDKVIASRERLARGLRDLGFQVLPSAANFLLASPGPGRDAQALFLALRQQGIIVRWFDRPRVRDYLRITVGTDAECDALLEALPGLMS